MLRKLAQDSATGSSGPSSSAGDKDSQKTEKDKKEKKDKKKKEDKKPEGAKEQKSDTVAELIDMWCTRLLADVGQAKTMALRLKTVGFSSESVTQSAETSSSQPC